MQKFGVLPTVHLYFAWISEHTPIVSLYRINWLVFITEAESVYCAVRTGSLYQTDKVSSVKGVICVPILQSKTRIPSTFFFALKPLYLRAAYDESDDTEPAWLTLRVSFVQRVWLHVTAHSYHH